MKKTPKQKTSKKKRHPKSITRRNLKRSLRFLPFIAPLIITAFIYAWLHTRMNIEGLSIEKRQAKKRELIKQNDSIRLRIEQLQAPARIESIAREKLEMITPQKWQVIPLDEPIQPPKQAVEISQHVQERLPSGRESAGLFGFLKKRGNLGSASRRHTSSSEAGRQSG